MTQQLTGLVSAEDRGALELECPCCQQHHRLHVVEFVGVPMVLDGDAVWWCAWCDTALNWMFATCPLPSWPAR